MFIQTENTPNPNSLKFLPGRKVSNNGPLEVLNLEDKHRLLFGLANRMHQLPCQQ